MKAGTASLSRHYWDKGYSARPVAPTARTCERRWIWGSGVWRSGCGAGHWTGRTRRHVAPRPGADSAAHRPPPSTEPRWLPSLAVPLGTATGRQRGHPRLHYDTIRDNADPLTPRPHLHSPTANKVNSRGCNPRTGKPHVLMKPQAPKGRKRVARGATAGARSPRHARSPGGGTEATAPPTCRTRPGRSRNHRACPDPIRTP
jgi:hypothetical protein